MPEALDPHDIQRDSFKLLDGGRRIRLIHLPTEATVEGAVGKDESSLVLHDRLMKELRKKVSGD